MTTQAWGGPSGGLPPELEVEREKLLRRQRIADAMFAQGQRGYQPQMAGGYVVPYSPFQGLAQVVNAYGGRSIGSEVDAGMADLGRRYNEGLADAVKNYTSSATVDKPAIESPPDEIGGGPGREAITVAADPRARVAQAMMSPYAQVRDMAKLDYQTAQQDKVRADERAFRDEQARLTREGRAEEARLAREQRMQELQLRLQDARATAADRALLQRELAQMRIDAQKELRTLTAASTPITAVTIQDPNDPNSTIVIDGRTRQVLGKGPKPTEAGKLELKRQFNMTGLGSTIQEAEDLLGGVVRGADGSITGAAQKPTGSLIGAGVDLAGSLIGASPAGSVEAQKLKAISGALVSKMPRMEGPQSDKDVLLYKEMAAEVGNPTVPVERRKAALDTVKRLWAQYERTGGQANAGPPKISTDADFNALPSGAVFIAPDGTQRRKP